MNSEMGVFALRQLVSSMVIVGPILIIVGAFNYIFTSNRKVVAGYVLSGIVLTAIGAFSLYLAFGARPSAPDAAESGEIESPSLGAVQSSMPRL